MLDGVVDQYLATVSEREFDASLIALLQANGFTDIHQLHGAFEFGKDFIANRRDNEELRQYALQSKAGDINLADWRTIRYQVDEIRTDGLAHPHFDRNLPRAAVLVTTGRLVGGAALQARSTTLVCGVSPSRGSIFGTATSCVRCSPPRPRGAWPQALQATCWAYSARSISRRSTILPSSGTPDGGPEHHCNRWPSSPRSWPTGCATISEPTSLTVAALALNRGHLGSGGIRFAG